MRLRKDGKPWGKPVRARQDPDQWASRQPEYRRNDHLVKNYGITLTAWEALFDGQGRVCALCLTSDSGSKKGWHTDHDHASGAIRGILCAKCNVRLGTLEDHAWVLRAQRYLER